MPVTIYPSPNAGSEKRAPLQGRYVHATSAERLLASTTTNDGSETGANCRGTDGNSRGLLQSSFNDLDRASPVFATKNGLVHGCLEAYNEHYHLVLRPDDVWLAILTQLSIHVNANAGGLRSSLVAHSGQKELHIEIALEGLDHGAMAHHMTKLMGENTMDPSLKDWILPAFTTTDKTDQAAASIVFMGTMQKYFTYSWGTRCGIPSVTLLGEAEDWSLIVQRCAERLGSGGLGSAAESWYHVLKPVLDGFLESFRNPTGSAIERFWKGIVDRHRPNGSGATTYSGWITAFCYWDEQGQCLHDERNGAASLSRSEVPMGFAKVPVTLLDSGRRIPTEMIAGSVGLTLKKSAASRDLGTEGSVKSNTSQRRADFDTIQPRSGWFMRFV